MKTILIVDDEAKIREVVRSYLEQAAYRVIEAATGREALTMMHKDQVHLIILDLMLPDVSGEEVCRMVRQTSALPIIMLTAKSAEEHRIQGLSQGADDYVLKPFSPRELVARVRAILRRSQEDQLLADRMEFAAGKLVFIPERREVFKERQLLVFTPNEYRLLLTMVRHPGRIFTREELVEKVFGFDYEGDIRTIDQHIKNVRAKLEYDPKQPQFIQTVFAVGYRFVGGD